MIYLSSYFRLQLKRAAKLIPQMLAVTLLLAALSALAALMLAKSNAQEASQAKIRIGVVGDEGESIIDEAIDMLGSMDTSRFSIGLERMEEKEAADLLRRGKITGYLLVPEGFADALWYGDHLPITYFSNSGGADVGAKLTRELVVNISGLVLETENAVYGAQHAVRDRLPDVSASKAGDNLVIRYGTGILDRERLYNIELLGVADSLSLAGYYLCGITLLFVMLWSISCSPFFSRRSRELGQILSSEGLGAPAQVGSEFISYLMLLLLALAAAGLLAFVMLSRFGIPIPELQNTEKSAFSLILRFLPPALMLCALQFLLYELSSSTVSAILLQFLNAAVQGYLSGCFYPSSFFPEGLRRFGALLPAGFGMRYLGAGLLSKSDPAAAAGVWFYLLLFLGLSLLVRSRRNRS
ncbi:MAG: ABC transporter permease [Oscillospiraceae bacterium]|nr:ABC transporter permease [Oscillospiraceae bacterium]